MIVEVANALSIQLGGMAFALTTGERRLRFIVPVGFVAGLCIHIVIGTVQSITLMQTWPWATIFLTAVLPCVWWWIRRGRDDSLAHPPVFGMGAALAGVGACAAVLSVVDRINFHVDSHEYMAIGSLLWHGSFAEGVSLFQIEKRLLAVPLMHAPGNVDGSYYLASLAPLLAVATVLILAWLSEAGLRKVAPQWLALVIAIAAALFLLSTNRFVHNAFYINGHLLFAVLFLLLIGTAWLMAKGSHHDFLPLQLLVIPVMIVTRAEAPLMLALAIAPIVLLRSRPLAHRIALTTVLGGSIIVWQLFLQFLYYQREATIQLSMIGMLAFGFLILLAWPLLRVRALQEHSIITLTSIEALLWALLVVAVVRDAEPLKSSLRATYDNVVTGVGGWGVALILVGVGALVALFAGASPGRVVLRFPLTSFVPLVLLLVYLRDGAYRVGPFDSLNRMLIHILPAAILFLVATATSRAQQPHQAGGRQPAADSDADHQLQEFEASRARPSSGM